MLYNRDIFTHGGHRFRFLAEYDEHMAEPWKEHDGHGIVSDWTTRDKAPGERVLNSDRSSRRFYDVQASITLAKRDQWGLGDDEKAKLAAQLGREPTPRDITARAVDLDFENLRAWCNDEWHWMCVGVEWLNPDDTVRAREWLSGIDGEGPYLEECAYELAEQLLYPARKAWRRALVAARKGRDMGRLCAVLAAPLAGQPAAT